MVIDKSLQLHLTGMTVSETKSQPTEDAVNSRLYKEFLFSTCSHHILKEEDKPWDSDHERGCLYYRILTKITIPFHNLDTKFEVSSCKQRSSRSIS